LPNYLVIATSGRAIAQGLKSLGHSVSVIDGFADRDTCTTVSEVVKVKRSQYGLDAIEAFHAVQLLQSKGSFDGLFYDAAMESKPDLIDKINIHSIVGNSSSTLRACKAPEAFFSMLEKNNITYPESHFYPESQPRNNNDWLVKDAVGTGGVGVTFLNDAYENDENKYLQKKVEGINFSLTFLANGKEISTLGFNTLWHESLGENMPYVYAGAINQVKLDADVQQTALQYASVIAKELDLIGLNSIDFIYAEKSVYVLEVNPRIPATYELYETKSGVLMHQHIEACTNRALPEEQLVPLLRAHAIVYAPTDITVSDELSWPLWTADRPHAQELIKKYEPICSIFAGGQNCAQVCEMINTRKQSIFALCA